MGPVEEEEELSNTESNKDYSSESDNEETESNGNNCLSKNYMLFPRIWIQYYCDSVYRVIGRSVIFDW